MGSTQSTKIIKNNKIIYTDMCVNWFSEHNNSKQDIIIAYIHYNFNRNTLFMDNNIIYIISLYYTENGYIISNQYSNIINKEIYDIRSFIPNIEFNLFMKYYIDNLYVLKNGELKQDAFFCDDDAPKIINKGCIDNEHIFILTKMNKLYKYNPNKYSVFEMTYHYYIDNTGINIIKNIIDIKSGYNHTLFLINNGNVYGYGSNKFGELGITSNINNNYSTKYYDYIMKITELQSLGIIITKIACGYHTSYVIDNQGILYHFGSNNQNISSSLNILWSFNRISQFNITYNHIGIINEYHNLYMYGDNSSAQCTHKTFNNIIHDQFVYKPRYVYPNVYRVKCGLNHTIFQTINGDWFSFGNNKSNQCLCDKTVFDDIIIKPTLIGIQFRKQNIIDIIPSRNDTFICVKI